MQALQQEFSKNDLVRISALREKAAGFLDLCFDAKRAAEITLDRGVKPPVLLGEN